MLKNDFIDSNLAPGYRLEDGELRLRRYRIACILSILGTASGISLDYIMYPKVFVELGMTRFFAVLIVSILYGVSRSQFCKSNIVFFNFVWAITINLSIVAMVYFTGGVSSPYYAGLNLVLLAAGVLLPLTLFETLFIGIATIFMYILACIFKGNWTDEWSLLFSNCFFVCLTGLISTTSSYFNSQARQTDFNLRHELDSRNRELEDMDRLKSDFFSNVSHELRTPLTLILSPIQDLLRKPESLSDRAAELIATARDNSLRLLKLVNDLLEVIRLEEGKEQIEMNPVDLNGLVCGLTDSIQHLADQRGISLVNELPDSISIVDGDIYAFERVFLNLLSNAVKFTQKGGSIYVRGQLLNDRTIIEVVDTGIGIKKEDIAYIFDRFRQVDSSSTRKYRGSGLGLALVKDLTERMSGEISAESEEGVGTTMKVSFPTSKSTQPIVEVSEAAPKLDIIQSIHQSAEHRAALPIDSPFEGMEGRPSSGKGPTLMIVDDEPAMRQYLTSVLEVDYRISLARDGEHALELARKYKPELMLLDLMLPKMDGHEVCKRLKADPKTRGIKIVLLTARIDENAKIIALDNGADDFLTKPFSRTEIETRLRNLLEASKLETEIRDRNKELEKTLLELKRTQASLVQSEKLNALGSLSAGLLHEVNNPLNYVIAALQMLTVETGKSANENLREYLTDITEGVDRIRNIVTDLHTFAHPSELDKQKIFSLSAAVESARRFTSHERDGVLIEQDLRGNDKLIGSQGHVIQVLVNLISNAIKAIKACDDGRVGEVKILSENHGDRVHVIVKDNGIGMSDEVKKNIFDPFFTTRDVGEGMGLGLSICHTIMKNHGGRIIVESDKGSGTAFTLDLPSE
ncbi:ATP-binding protein [Puniceicoccaceae bacterium K14]|nr:ATP-binding protein [Puniceicoccaceae bacterium K14]